MLIIQVCQALEKAKASFAVVGGYAVALHGAVRGTVDVDIAVLWTLKNLQMVENTLISLGLVSRLPVCAEDVFLYRDEYIKNRHLTAWNFYDPANPANQVDIVINYDLEGARTETIKTKSGKIRILSRKDLIAMKRASGSPQDLEDAKALEEV